MTNETQKIGEWRTIESAPRDGSFILGAWQNQAEEWLYGVFMWRHDLEHHALSGWFFVCGNSANRITLWQPLPPPPTGGAS